MPCEQGFVAVCTVVPPTGKMYNCLIDYERNQCCKNMQAAAIAVLPI